MKKHKPILITNDNYHYIPNLNDIAAQYDIYYQNGDHSIYNQRFGKNRIIPREASIINSQIKKVLHKLVLNQDSNSPITFRIFDFGCGDGRLFKLLEANAIKYQKLNVKFEINAYDISKVALKCFEENLRKQEYIDYIDKTSITKCPAKEKRLIKSFRKDNVIVKIIQGYNSDNINHIQNLVGNNIHLNLCMFSTISHVKPRTKRQEILQLFNQLASAEGAIIVTAPWDKTFRKEYEAFSTLRQFFVSFKKYNLTSYYEVMKDLIDLVNEDGDVLYLRHDNKKALINYCHIYSAQEFADDMKAVGLYFTNVEVLSRNYLPILTKKTWILRKIDQLISCIFSLPFIPYSWAEKVADQWVCVSYPRTKFSS